MPAEAAKILPLKSKKKRPKPEALGLAQLLIRQRDLAQITCLSLRSVKRLTAEGVIPGTVRLGKSLRYDVEKVREWVRLGCPRPDARRK